MNRVDVLTYRQEFARELSARRIGVPGQPVRTRAVPSLSLVFDLRDVGLQELSRRDRGVLWQVEEARRDLLRWITGHGRRPEAVPPIVLVHSGSSQVHHLQAEYARRGVPSFLFSLGIEVVDATLQAPTKLVSCVQAAIGRACAHPLVARSSRADELFGSRKVDASFEGLPTFIRMPRRESTGGGDHKHELRITVPSTYQIKGGHSIPLPDIIRDEVVRQVVTTLTCGEHKEPTYDTGYTLLPGSGCWFSTNAGLHVQEAVSLLLSHLSRIDENSAKSIARYLRFSWLQDYVFATLDGKVVGQ